MLGRTAQNLFWLSRYVERAENMARLLEVGYRMSLTSRREGGASEHLLSMMQAAEVDEDFAAGARAVVRSHASHSKFQTVRAAINDAARACEPGRGTPRPRD